MSDPYRSYRPGRGEPRYDYPPDPEYDYQPTYPGRGGISEPPYDRPYGDPYARDPSYDIPPASRAGAPRGDYRAPRGDYRQPPPIRAEPDYSRRGGRDYVPPPAPRGPVGDPYSAPAYYPPEDRSHRAPPPPREAYERGYPPPEPAYRDDSRYSRRRPREDDYEAPAHSREYDYNYEPELPASQRRPPPIEYRGGTTATYEVDQRRRPRDSRDPTSRLPPSMPSQPSPESGDDEFTLPADGIKKEVLQKYITRFLGNDAVSRGPMKEGDTLVYKYSAYRQFTTEQIRDLKKASEYSEPGYARGMDARTREAPGPAITVPTSRPSGRRNTDEDSMMTEPVIPRDEYIYTAGSQGARPPAREIRAGRPSHDPPYGTSYHEPVRHGRPPIEASQMRPGPDDDDEMED